MSRLFICRTCRLWITRPATRPRSAGRCSATDARSASPRSPVRSSMSEAGTEKAPKAEKKPKKREEKSAGTAVAIGAAETDPNYVPRFKKRYNDEIRPELMKQFGYTNVMQVPRINK